MGLVNGFLLDTHALLWWYTDSEKLSGAAYDALARRDERRSVSAVSGYEVALKHRQGKLPDAEPLLADFVRVLHEDGFEMLPLALDHMVAAGQLDLRHKDPFDRMLIAQCALNDLTAISGDKAFDLYGVRRLW